MHDIDMKDEENNGYKWIFIRYWLNNTQKKKITKKIVLTIECKDMNIKKWKTMILIYKFVI